MNVSEKKNGSEKNDITWSLKTVTAQLTAVGGHLHVPAPHCCPCPRKYNLLDAYRWHWHRKINFAVMNMVHLPYTLRANQTALPPTRLKHVNKEHIVWRLSQ